MQKVSKKGTQVISISLTREQLDWIVANVKDRGKSEFIRAVLDAHIEKKEAS